MLTKCWDSDSPLGRGTTVKAGYTGIKNLATLVRYNQNSGI
jgi:hypothetical protein